MVLSGSIGFHDPWGLAHYRDRIPEYYGTTDSELVVEILNVYASSVGPITVEAVLLALSSVVPSGLTRNRLDYLSSLEWLHTNANLAFVGPPGPGKSHTLVALGHGAVHSRK